MKTFAAIVGLLVGSFGMILIFTLPVYWLWNWLMPDIFGLKIISFWQALGLTTLSSFLFKSNNSSSKDK